LSGPGFARCEWALRPGFACCERGYNFGSVVMQGIGLLCAFALFAQTGRSPQALLKEATEFQQAGKLDEAIADYKQILEMYPDLAPVRSNLGAALAGSGRYSEAIVEYNRALAKQPDPHVRLNLAIAYYKTTQLQKAAETLVVVRRETPNDVQAVTLLADCYLRLGRNKDVIQLLTPLQQAGTSDLGIAYMLGTALIRDNQVSQGQVIIDPILKNGDSAEARLLMGTTKLMVNDLKGAVVDLQRAVELNPKLPDVYSYYGSALLSTGDPAGAQKAFQKELALDPNSFEANLRMGVLLRQDEDNAGAMKYFQRALLVRPGDIGVRYQMAATDLALGDVEPARKELEAMLKEAPNFTEAHVTLATVYYREKRKADGDRERAMVSKLNAEKQAAEPAQSVK
jgi:tetratricopeptide (TPR) repeat protein